MTAPYGRGSEAFYSETLLGCPGLKGYEFVGFATS